MKPTTNTVWIDVRQHRMNLLSAFKRVTDHKPHKVVFVGSAPAFELMAREEGFEVEVHPVGTHIPTDALVV